jgi:putative protease
LNARKKPELLAPAGSWAALEAAVNSGADAVYLGGTNFGARAFADNFDRDSIKHAVRFAHLRMVKIYVTVNTLVDDSEMKDLAGYLVFLSNTGVDGIIVQDMGVIRLARRIVPELPLHASTQMTVTSSAGVRFAAANGMCRVVPARELSLVELKDAVKQGVEIESFIHGALCVCYSGQCLMSSLIGGRSGNRGNCAQPCRMAYSLVDAAGNDVLSGRGVGPYLLSPKDLNTLNVLPQLIDSGVCSFKIEGRMKRPEYVATVVGAYRRSIDSFFCGAYSVNDDDKRDVEQIFNRGVSTAYLCDRPGKNMMSPLRPDNRGVRIGTVVKVDSLRHEADIQLEDTLRVSDGVEFSSHKRESVGTTVTRLSVNGAAAAYASSGSIASVAVPRGVRVGMTAFKTIDVELMARAARFYGECSLRRVPVDMTVKARLGEPLELTLRDHEGRIGRAQTVLNAEKALNRPLDETAVRRQVERLGTTAYCMGRLEVELDEGIIVPASEINEVRRKACRSLDEARLGAFVSAGRAHVDEDASLRMVSVSERVQNDSSARAKPELTVWIDTLDKAEAALRGDADWLIFGGDRFSSKDRTWDEYGRALEIAHKKGKKCAFSTSRIIKERDENKLSVLFKTFDSFAPDALYVHNLSVWQLARENGMAVPLWADASLNVFNSQSLEFWKENGAGGAVVSLELNMSQIERLARKKILPLECLVHGLIEMMVSEYCAPGSWLGRIDKGSCVFACQKDLFLSDRTGARFLLKGDQHCRMHVLNSRELCMIDRLQRFVKAGIARVRIDARTMNAAETEKLTRAYRSALDSRVYDMPSGLYTHGHYNRGVTK